MWVPHLYAELIRGKNPCDVVNTPRFARYMEGLRHESFGTTDADALMALVSSGAHVVDTQKRCDDAGKVPMPPWVRRVALKTTKAVGSPTSCCWCKEPLPAGAVAVEVSVRPIRGGVLCDAKHAHTMLMGVVCATRFNAWCLHDTSNEGLHHLATQRCSPLGPDHVLRTQRKLALAAAVAVHLMTALDNLCGKARPIRCLPGVTLDMVTKVTLDMVTKVVRAATTL